MTQKVVLRLTGEMIQCSGASAWISESLKDPAAILQASFSNANSITASAFYPFFNVCIA